MKTQTNQRSIRFNLELDEALKYWNELTGIPVNAIVQQGTMLKIKELEKIYGKSHKEQS